MSSTDNTTQEWREETSALRRTVAGAIRRMAISLTSGTFWQAVGHLLLDSATRETRDAEVFSGIGFYARPRAGGNAEAVVVFPGGPSNPIIIATRDEDARKAMAALAEDETAVFNSTTVIVVKANGTVEIRGANGIAQPLATKADLAALTAVYNAHTHLYTPGPGLPAPTAIPVAPGAMPSGTTVLKAQ